MLNYRYSLIPQSPKGAVFGSSVAGAGFFSGLGGKPNLDAAAKNPFGQTNFGTVDSPSKLKFLSWGLAWFKGGICYSELVY